MEQNKNLEKYYRIEDITYKYGVCDETARRWARAGLLRGERVGKRWFFVSPKTKARKGTTGFLKKVNLF